MPRWCFRPNSAVRLRRTAPAARRSHSWRAIVPTRPELAMPMATFGSSAAVLVLAKLGFRAAHAACPAFVFARAFLPTPMTWLLMSGREPGFIAGDAAPASKQQCGYLWSAAHRDALIGRHQRRPSTVLGCVGEPAS